MANGMQAKAGFDYQDTVTLLVLLEHFKEHGESARVRPEGSDDLVLAWTEAGLRHVTQVQIKKPKTDALGNRKPESWSLSEAAQRLFLPSLPRSAVPASALHSRQIFILGDAVEQEVHDLLRPGSTERLDASYLALLHLLAKDRSGLADEVKSKADKTALTQWRPPPPAFPGQERAALWDAWGQSLRQCLTDRGIHPLRIADYLHELEALDRLLPNMLAQMEFRESYGSEQEVTERVCQAYQAYFGLSAPVVSDTLFRNLRGFISDIAKIPDRWIDRQELELELRSVWPEMVLVRDMPLRGPAYVERPHVIHRLNGAIHGNALEVIGISGSGKTLLASEWLEALEGEVTACWAMYIQVRPGHRLRDILAGFAFRLRRYGVSQLFEIITRSHQTDEAVIEAVAGAISTLPQDVALLIDFVEGRGNDGLYQDLARLIRRLSGRHLHLALFAQEQVLPHLSPVERQIHGVECFEPPGLQFEEFIELVSRFQPHQAVDRTLYWNLFERASAHRTSGVLPGMADILARASGATLLAIQQNPASDLIGVAERQRFDRVQRKTAAEKLLCFMLPFRPRDAQQIFPGEPIIAAIEEMRALGLLRPHDADHVEMHEAVRDRLEKSLAPDLLRETHQLLARNYQESGQIIAAIAHLEKSGATDAARGLAREVYLRGEHQWELQGFIRHHRVLTADEIVERLKNGSDGPCRELLRGGMYPEVAPILLQAIHTQPERFDKDYRWVWDLVEGLLLSDPRYLYDITAFALSRPRSTDGKQSSIDWVVFAAGRAGVEIDKSTLDLFQRSDDETKRRLVQILLHDARRETLKVAFEFLRSQQISPDSGRSGPLGLRIPLHQEKHIIEFLAALPSVTGDALLAGSSIQLGVLSDFVWHTRSLFQKVCRRLLATPSEHEDTVLISAMRVLLYLGDVETRRLTEGYLLGHQDREFLKTLAMLAISTFPQPGDREKFKQVLLEPSLKVEDRIAVMVVLVKQGVSLSEVITTLTSGDSRHAEAYRYIALMMANSTPFPGVVQLLESKLAEVNEEQKTTTLALLYLKLAELPGQEITEALIRALSSPWASVRAFALMGLHHRRVRCAGEPIAILLDKEQDRTIAAIGLLSELASGPVNMDRFQSLWERFPDFEYWRCVMIGRLRAVEEASVLVRTAVDSTKPWEVRRAAILAAGRLPYEVALAHIVEPLMRERSPFSGDNASLFGHSLLVTLLGQPRRDVIESLQKIPDSFVELWSHIYDKWKSHWIPHWGDEPTGADAIAWLYQSLKEHGVLQRAEAAREVDNELHIPILQSAVLRALHLARRPDVLETIALEAQEEWLLIRALTVHSKNHSADKSLPLRVRERHEQAGRPIGLRLARVLGNLSTPDRSAPPIAAPQDTEASKPSDALPTHSLDYAAVLNALNSGQLPAEENIALLIQNEAEFRDLVLRLDPRNDERLEYRSVKPQPALRSDGIAVYGVKSVRIDRHASVRKRLRPLFVATNELGIEIPWHRFLLTPTPQPSDYLKDYLKCLCRQNRLDIFAKDLEKNGDYLLEMYRHPEVHPLVTPLINECSLPALARFSSFGPTELLSAVCGAASLIISPAVDPVLSAAFMRWLAWFDRNEKRPQHTEHSPLWASFHILSRHPRFEHIPSHEQRLMEICALNIAPHCKQAIMSYLCHRSACYVFIEQQLMRAASFEIYYHDEVDKLDDAADSLFGQTGEM